MFPVVFKVKETVPFPKLVQLSPSPAPQPVRSIAFTSNTSPFEQEELSVEEDHTGDIFRSREQEIG